MHRDDVSSDALGTSEISDGALVGLILIDETTRVDNEGAGFERPVKGLNCVLETERSGVSRIGIRRVDRRVNHDVSCVGLARNEMRRAIERMELCPLVHLAGVHRVHAVVLTERLSSLC